MKLGPWEFRRVKAADQPTTRAQKEIGASGTINLDGFLQAEEYNPDLQGKRGLDTYERMLFSDATVQEAIEHLFSPIKNASWEVTPPDDPDEDELTATALVDAALFDWLDQPWLEHLDNVLEYLPYGHAVVEPTWTVLDRELRVMLPPPDGAPPADTSTKLLPSRQWLTLDRFAPRLQETIYKWHTEGGKLTSIVQQAFKDGDWNFFEMPIEDLIVFVHKRRGDDFNGRSILRPAVKAWKLKELVEKVSVIAIERHGIGLPTAYMPRDKVDDGATAAKLTQMLQDIRAGAFNFMLIPGPKAQAGVDGFLIEILSPSGGIPDFTNFLEYLRAEIKASVLARFAELGHASVGARATGDVQSIVWFAKLHETARYIAEQHDTVIRRLVDANLPGVTRYPKLTVTGIEVRNLAEFSKAMADAVASGAVHPDTPFRAFVRRELGAPEEEEPPPDAGVDPNADGPQHNPPNDGAPDDAPPAPDDTGAHQ